MEFYSDHFDVYLNGNKLDYVVGASELTGSAAIMERDYRSLVNNPEIPAFIPSDHISNYHGYAVLLCRGEIKVIPKPKPAAPAYEWLPTEEGEMSGMRLLTSVTLTMVKRGCIAPHYLVPGLGDEFKESAISFLGATESSVDGSLVVNFHSWDGPNFYMLVAQPRVEIYTNCFSDPTLTPEANLIRHQVDLVISASDDFCSLQTAKITLERLCMA